MTFMLCVKAVCDCNLFLYADDSALFISDKDVGRIQVNLSKELCKVRDWLSENKLMLHLGKTESILFGSKQNLNKVSKLSVRVGDCLISNRTSVNYLGCRGLHGSQNLYPNPKRPVNMLHGTDLDPYFI